MNIVSNHLQLPISKLLFLNCQIILCFLILFQLQFLRQEVGGIFLILKRASQFQSVSLRQCTITQVIKHQPSSSYQSPFGAHLFWTRSAKSHIALQATDHAGLEIWGEKNRKGIAPLSMKEHTATSIFIQADHLIHKLLRGKSPALAFLDLFGVTAALGDQICDIQHNLCISNGADFGRKGIAIGTYQA